MWHNLSKELQKVKSQILKNDHLESKIKEKDINLAVVFLQTMKMTPIVFILWDSYKIYENFRFSSHVGGE